jgi:nucleoid DNA-binding protein
MDKLEFIEYSANRYGVDFSTAETLLDMFSSCLQELLQAGKSVEIDGVGKFEKLPLFPNGLNHRNNINLARIAKKNIVCFQASENLELAQEELSNHKQILRTIERTGEASS